MILNRKVPKFFQTAGPVQPDFHYCVEPLNRIDLKEIEMMIYQQKYFVLHAPRQTGKTSCLLALQDYLNIRGEFIAIYINVEAGQAYCNDVYSVGQSVAENIANRTDIALGNRLADEVLNTIPPGQKDFVTTFLTKLCVELDRPLVLFIDGIDALAGDALVSILRQIHAGYDLRPSHFPQTVILCGEHDLRDYRIVLSNQEIVTGSSVFNIEAESLQLRNFTEEEIEDLYMQHTDSTGQEFDEVCIPLIREATEGQPWLVNALGYEVTMKMEENRKRTIRITSEMFDKAKENIINRRDVHIDILIDKLHEERVRRVIDPILANEEHAVESLLPEEDIQYVADMGLISLDRPRRIANGIYREIIPRELTWSTQNGLPQQSSWYTKSDNSLNMEKVLLDFQQFFRQNADAWLERFSYKDSGPQLLLQAFLQRIANGGYIKREYALGRGRTDLLITKPLTNRFGGPIQHIAVEIKTLNNDLDATIARGLEQTSAFMDRCAPEAEGHFILFNRDKDIPWDEKIWHRYERYGKLMIGVWGM